jgi:hypothetical protein
MIQWYVTTRRESGMHPSTLPVFYIHSSLSNHGTRQKVAYYLQQGYVTLRETTTAFLTAAIAPSVNAVPQERAHSPKNTLSFVGAVFLFFFLFKCHTVISDWLHSVILKPLHEFCIKVVSRIGQIIGR